MTLKIEDHLSNDDKRKLDELKSSKKEQFSRKDIEELMGVRRDTYVRSKGAIRRK
jgi:hypothetical protein